MLCDGGVDGSTTVFQTVGASSRLARRFNFNVLQNREKEISMSVGDECVNMIKVAIRLDGESKYLDGYLDEVMPFNRFLLQLEKLTPTEINEAFLTVLNGVPELSLAP